jgi:transposase
MMTNDLIPRLKKLPTLPPYIGIDVAKYKLDGASSSGPTISIHVRDMSTLVDWVTKLNPQMVVIEASGGYERDLVAALVEKNIPTAVVNPRQVRHFARATGELAKTDILDAKVLAKFGEAIQPPLYDQKSHEHMALRDLVARRRQLIEMRKIEKTRLDGARTPILKTAIKRHIDWLSSEIKDADKDLDDAIKANPAFLEDDEILQSVPGIGKGLSQTLILELSELASMNQRQAAALVGVAPMNYDSGMMRGRRGIKGGRSHVRSVLYMATVTAIKRNVVVKAVYDRHKSKGRPFKVALVAAMHQLLKIAQTLLKTRQKWNPDLANITVA